jgi:hypothetical protein
LLVERPEPRAQPWPHRLELAPHALRIRQRRDVHEHIGGDVATAAHRLRLWIVLRARVGLPVRFALMAQYSSAIIADSAELVLNITEGDSAAAT